MMDSGSAVALAEEDLWRTGLYALIARLFFDGPDDALLAQLAGYCSGINEEDSGDNQPLG